MKHDDRVGSSFKPDDADVTMNIEDDYDMNINEVSGDVNAGAEGQAITWSRKDWHHEANATR